MSDRLKKYILEALGTYFLVFAGTGAIIVNAQTGVIGHVGVAITWGLIVMALIYAIGDQSGAHINPAVTIAFFIAKRFNFKDLVPYILFQVGGAFLASITLKILFPSDAYLGTSLPSGTWEQSFILEFILTFLLMFVILKVSHGSKEKGIMAGAAIGAVVGLEAMFAGPICGASMNPARSIAPAVVSGNVQYLWVYIFATILGAIAAVSLFSITKNIKNT